MMQAAQPHTETPAPSFAAPMRPAAYTRRILLEPHRTLARVTPQSDFFVLAHLGIPQVDAQEWRLEIAGLVERPLTLSLDDIRRLPMQEVESFHQCAGAPRRPDLAARRIANVVWSGADLAQLLGRLVVPGWYGTNTVKWLWRLELAEGRSPGPFTTEFYNDPDPSSGGRRPVWAAPPEALIVAPPPRPHAAGPVEIWGWAWAAAGVAMVEVSVDGGDSWSPARIEPRRQWSWQRFAFDWRPGASGSFTLCARATDALGAVQPMAKARNAVHRVAVEIA